MSNMPVTKIKFTLRKRGKSTWCLPKAKGTNFPKRTFAAPATAPPIH